MSSSTFVQRLLSATISSGNGQNFAGTTSSQIQLSGLRMSSKVSNAGGFTDSMLDLTIWGMTDAHMNALSTFGMQIQQVTAANVTLQAGNAEDGVATVFSGFIVSAYADYSAQPEVCFRLSAQAAYPQKVVPAQASSFSGTADVATIATGLANTMGFRFENNGVNVKLSNPYFSGSAMDQFSALKKAAGIEGSVINGTLSIWPRNGSRNGSPPVVSVQTGMIGYPTFTAYGLMVTTIYNPLIGLGQKVQVVSSLQPACMTGSVYALDHELDSLVPKGKWFSHVAIYNPARPTPVQK